MSNGRNVEEDRDRCEGYKNVTNGYKDPEQPFPSPMLFSVFVAPVVALCTSRSFIKKALVAFGIHDYDLCH